MKQLDDQFEDEELRNSMALIRTIEAEKRTYLAELRTGIGILTISLSLLTVLIATSEYYSIQNLFFFILALITGIFVMSVIGFFLVFRAFQRLRAKERLKRNTCLTTEEIAARANSFHR
ncbi:hypothetical protein EU545_00140 [Candidatus Thorarchaeota archaeon]|jgi:uncharacterized membrane protein YidH (DUF202 family)|nr:MAG: hypothetical protein EU545_00140 [Candidatus Thorarchaeota archaeon]